MVVIKTDGNTLYGKLSFSRLKGGVKRNVLNEEFISMPLPLYDDTSSFCLIRVALEDLPIMKYFFRKHTASCTTNLDCCCVAKRFSLFLYFPLY